MPPAVHIDDPSAAARALATKAPGLRRKILEKALGAYRCGGERGLVGGEVIAVIDYSRPSTRRRLWVLDLSTEELLFYELVAHGSGSGKVSARKFSNEPGSHRSSLGLFRAERTYQGRNGLSLKLRGLEAGINDNAFKRAIVLHGARYVSRSHVVEHGQLGRSLGCPAVEMRVYRQIIGRMVYGTALFSYADDPGWLETSSFFECAPDR